MECSHLLDQRDESNNPYMQMVYAWVRIYMDRELENVAFELFNDVYKLRNSTGNVIFPNMFVLYMNPEFYSLNELNLENVLQYHKECFILVVMSQIQRCLIASNLVMSMISHSINENMFKPTSVVHFASDPILTSGKNRFVGYCPHTWKLDTTILYVILYHSTKGSLILLQHVELVAVLHRKMIPRGQLLLLLSLEIFRFDYKNVTRSLNSTCIMLALAVCVTVNRGSVFVTKVLKCRDLPPKHGTPESYAAAGAFCTMWSMPNFEFAAVIEVCFGLNVIYIKHIIGELVYVHLSSQRLEAIGIIVGFPSLQKWLDVTRENDFYAPKLLLLTHDLLLLLLLYSGISNGVFYYLIGVGISVLALQNNLKHKSKLQEKHSTVTSDCISDFVSKVWTELMHLQEASEIKVITSVNSIIHNLLLDSG